MGSWSTFRRVRLFIFALIVIVSLLLTIFFSLFFAKDFKRYNTFQRVIVIGLAVVNGITAILMYLMLVLRYSILLDAVRIAVLLIVQTAGTALFALRSPSFPCNAFGGNRTCRQISSCIAIVAWVLCGLLVTYGACLIILACTPHPLPIEGLETGLDDAVPVSPQAQRIAHYSIDSHTLLMESDRGLPPYSTRPLPAVPGLRFIEKPGQQVQQQSGVGYNPKYLPNTPGSGSAYSSTSPTSIMEVEYGSPNYVDERRLLPPLAIANPIPRVLTQTPVSMYSNRTIQAPTSFASGPRATYMPAPPPVAQFNPSQRPQPRRTRSSSMSSSIYSSMSGEFRQGIPPPRPYMAARWVAPDQQSVRSMATSSSESVSSQTSQWKQLVLDAAAGRRQAPL